MQNQCAKQNKFVEAELCKQRLVVFRQKEKDKILEEVKQAHQEQANQLDIEKREELEQFNTKWDIDYFNIRDKFEKVEAQLKENQMNEFNNKKAELEEEMANFIMKPSSEAINLNKIIENLVKQKEFTKAHEAQIKLTSVVKQDQERMKAENQKKVQNEINKMTTKHDNELNAFKLKMKSEFDEYKKSRAIEYDNLVQKYKNRIKELDNNQKKDVIRLNKKGNMTEKNKHNMTRNSSKISNVLDD